MSTVSTTINHGITLGTSGYLSPLTIATGGYVDNPGTGSALVAAYAGTMVNDGRLRENSSGAGDRAVLLRDGGTLDNQASGVISAPDGSTAVYIGGSATAVGVVTNLGTVSGGTGVAFAAGNALAQTLIDTGTIIGSGGTGVAFGAGNDTLQFLPSVSAYIRGAIDGGGANTLVFVAGGGAGTLAGYHATFTNFSDATVAAGGVWSLAGSITFGTDTTLTNAG